MKNHQSVRDSRAPANLRPNPVPGQRYRHADGYFVRVLTVALLATSETQVTIRHETSGREETRRISRFLDEIKTEIQPDAWEPRYTLVEASVSVVTAATAPSPARLSQDEREAFIERDENYRTQLNDLLDVIDLTPATLEAFRNL